MPRSGPATRRTSRTEATRIRARVHRYSWGMLRAVHVGERVVVGGRLGDHRRALPGGGALGHAPVGGDGEHGLAAPAERVAHLQARGAAVDRGHGAGVALQQPRLVVVVHGEHAVGPQVGAGLGDRLDGEQVVLQAQGRLAGDDRERVGQGQHHQVVAPAGLLQERPAVVDVGRDPRVEVGAVGVAVASQALQGRVDLDRVHVPGPLGQGHGHVVAGAGPDHQHLVQGPGGRCR